jgi:hypothetical protein
MIPVDYSTRGFGDYGAIPNAIADFCNGPENFAVPDWPDQYFTRWVLWRASDGVRFAKAAPGFVPADGLGTLTGLFNGDTAFTALSGGFDQNGQLVVAVERSGGEIELRRFQAGNPTAFTWSGKSPRVFYNGELEFVVADTDVVCFYLPEDGDRILVRVQRDNYGVEYELNPALNTPLDRLTKVDRVQDVKVALWGMTGGAGRADVRQSVLISQPHPPWPGLSFDLALQSIGFIDGVYLSTVVQASDAEDGAAQSVAFDSGAYVSTVVEHSELEEASQDVELVNGDYALTVITEVPPEEQATELVRLFQGSYDLVVINGPSNSEPANQSVAFLEGSYDEA